jgi:uncharacterized damage-inducible protein DinB
MQKTEIALLFEYLFWLRDRILRAASELSIADFVSPDTVTSRDLRATLVHELEGQWGWRERLAAGTFPEGELTPSDYRTLDALAGHWRRDEAEMRRWVAGLTDEQLATAPRGEDDPFPLWYYAVHILSHAIQQYSEAAVLLTRSGHSPGEIGFLEFVESLPKPTGPGLPAPS